MFGRKTDQPARQSDMELFTIFDSKTGQYELPSFAINQHDIVRQIINMFKDPQQRNNKFLVNAEDYSCFRIGNFCKKTGTLVAHNPEHVANLHDLRVLAQPSPQESSRDVHEASKQAHMTKTIQAIDPEYRN